MVMAFGMVEVGLDIPHKFREGGMKGESFFLRDAAAFLFYRKDFLVYLVRSLAQPGIRRVMEGHFPFCVAKRKFCPFHSFLLVITSQIHYKAFLSSNIQWLV